MSKNLAEQFFSRLKDIGPEVNAEMSRMAGLGAAELAAALFRGDPFVMYGPNQRAAKVEQEHSVFGNQEQAPEHAQEQSHDSHKMERGR